MGRPTEAIARKLRADEIKHLESVVRAARRAAKFHSSGMDLDRLQNAIDRLDRWRRVHQDPQNRMGG